MAGPKIKLRYSEETPWFPKYYIDWIEIGNYDQETSNKYNYNRLKMKEQCQGFFKRVMAPF